MNHMKLRDRGKIKWQPATFIPLTFEMQRKMFMDQDRKPKPIIDEYEEQEFDRRINYAMQNNVSIKLMVWVDGFTKEVCGRIHNFDPITKEIRFEVNPGKLDRINIKNVVGVVID
jgi:hypothetical protein